MPVDRGDSPTGPAPCEVNDGRIGLQGSNGPDEPSKSDRRAAGFHDGSRLVGFLRRYTAPSAGYKRRRPRVIGGIEDRKATRASDITSPCRVLLRSCPDPDPPVPLTQGSPGAGITGIQGKSQTDFVVTKETDNEGAGIEQVRAHF
jgi:hypothetical protein